jgi:hypothetical protein
MLEAKNKFQKNDEARAANRAALNRLNRTDAAAKQAQKREAWTRPTRQSFGLLLDQRTLSAKAAAIAERRKTEPEKAHMEESTVLAKLETWLRRNPTFYDSDFNGISMRNFLLKAWHEKGIAPSIELLDSAYQWLQANGHLECDPRVPRKRGDVACTAVPRLFEYRTPEEAEELEQRQASEAVERRISEDAAKSCVVLRRTKTPSSHWPRRGESRSAFGASRIKRCQNKHSNHDPCSILGLQLKDGLAGCGKIVLSQQFLGWFELCGGFQASEA